jgi:hypothetical protein
MAFVRVTSMRRKSRKNQYSRSQDIKQMESGVNCCLEGHRSRSVALEE